MLPCLITLLLYKNTISNRSLSIALKRKEKRKRKKESKMKKIKKKRRDGNPPSDKITLKQRNPFKTSFYF